MQAVFPMIDPGVFASGTEWLGLAAKLGKGLFWGLYGTVLALICVYGFHRYLLIYLFYRHRHKVPKPLGQFGDLPHVTVQLPVYNERYVVRRLIQQACQMNYPAGKLEIQVLDDSTDETSEICRKMVDRMREQGHDIVYLHRDNRVGYKAGALEEGLRDAKGEFILIFDADFLPPPDILNNTIHYFTDPKVGMVQTRWEHINREYSLLTRGQAIYLDSHFAVEHTARNRSGRFMNFNGTAGIWRRRAIQRAGGWQHDTLTEDLDLSFRAQLIGWKFVYLPDLTSPAELPVEMNAFKHQQHRWTKGGIQTAKKLLPRILRSSIPWYVKVEAFFQLTGSTAYLYTFLLSLLIFPAFFAQADTFDIAKRGLSVLDVSLFVLATCAAASFFMVGQREAKRPNWFGQILYLPILMAIGIGVTLINSKGIIEALLGKESGFNRTPKFGVTGRREDFRKRNKYKNRLDWLPILEIMMGVYFTVMIAVTWDRQTIFSLPFCTLFMSGYYYVGLSSLLQTLRRAPAAEGAPATPVPASESSV